MLPKFQPTPYNGDEPPHSNRGGEDSSHLTLTDLPGFNPRDPGTSRITLDINCAVIYCEGAMREGRSRRFAPTNISSAEAAFHIGDQPCSIPSMINLPLWMRTYRHDPTIYNRENTVATWLHVIGDLDAEGFGFATKKWLDNAVVVRVDGKDLLPQHLEALSFFCRHVFEEVIGENFGCNGLSDNAVMRKMQKATFRKLVSKTGFMEFYERYCSEKAMLDEHWRRLPSPYYDNVIPSKDEPLTNGNHWLSRGTKVVNGDTTAPPEPRRSRRPTRLPARILDDSPTTAALTEDEPRGRTRKRRSSDSEYE